MTPSESDIDKQIRARLTRTFALFLIGNCFANAFSIACFMNYMNTNNEIAFCSSVIAFLIGLNFVYASYRLGILRGTEDTIAKVNEIKRIMLQQVAEAKIAKLTGKKEKEVEN